MHFMFKLAIDMLKGDFLYHKIFGNFLLNCDYFKYIRSFEPSIPYKHSSSSLPWRTEKLYAICGWLPCQNKTANISPKAQLSFVAKALNN